MPLLAISDLKVTYGAVEAVRGIDLEIGEGEIVALLGANGAGKTSTLNALAGLVPARGGIQFRGEELIGIATENRVSKGLTLSPEGRRVFATLTVEDNLKMGGYGLPDPGALSAAFERAYGLFPILKERRAQLAGTLSGGQQQMLAIGRALMSGPKLLLLDEPSLGLAPRLVEQVLELITTLRDQGVTILLVEQNVAEALEIADRGYVMAEGRIVNSGRAHELRDSGELAAAYLGGA